MEAATKEKIYLCGAVASMVALFVTVAMVLLPYLGFETTLDTILGVWPVLSVLLLALAIWHVWRVHEQNAQLLHETAERAEARETQEARLAAEAAKKARAESEYRKLHACMMLARTELSRLWHPPCVPAGQLRELSIRIMDQWWSDILPDVNQAVPDDEISIKKALRRLNRYVGVVGLVAQETKSLPTAEFRDCYQEHVLPLEREALELRATGHDVPWEKKGKLVPDGAAS